MFAKKCKIAILDFANTWGFVNINAIQLSVLKINFASDQVFIIIFLHSYSIYEFGISRILFICLFLFNKLTSKLLNQAGTILGGNSHDPSYIDRKFSKKKLYLIKKEILNYYPK